MSNCKQWIAIYLYPDYPEIAMYYDFQMWDIRATGQDPDTFELAGLVFAAKDSLVGINAHDIMTGKETKFPVLAVKQ